MSKKTYTKMLKYKTFKERFDYLKLDGIVGMYTFGEDRHLNQRLYTSSKWKRIRDEVIIRDMGMDLAIEGMDIFGTLIVHHINPITPDDILNDRYIIYDLDNLVCTSFRTHNALHYGNPNMIPDIIVDRKPGDTKLW